MPSFSDLFRLLLLGLLILGLALPAMAAVPDRPAPAKQQACHDVPVSSAADPVPADPAPLTETCHQHCLAATLLPAPVAPAMAWGKATPLQPLPLVEAAPSLSPQPEGHPPRL